MPVTRMFSRSALMLIVAGLLISSGCSSSKPATTATSMVNEGYARAVKMYDKKDYDAAALGLESLIFTSRATAVEDDVLFLLAQSYYHSKQYLLASEIYTRLLQQIPSTPYARTAQFMLAKSHEKLSPHFELDQTHTRKAIEQFAVYLDLYPSVDSLSVAGDVETYRELLKINPDSPSYKQNYSKAVSQLSRVDSLKYAVKAIPVLREKLAKNSYSIARQYIQLRKLKAAGIFFDEVIKRYSETVYAPQAWVGKIDVLVKRKKWFEAGQALDQYLQLYPDKQQEMQAVRTKITQNFSNN